MASSQKVKKPIKELQQLRRLSYNPNVAAKDGGQGAQRQGGNQLQEMQLEKVIGTSSKGSNSMQVNPANGDICYLAGSRIVIYSPRDAKQVKFLASRTSRPFQCARFSSDGKYLAAGESAFRLPQITIWEITYEESLQGKTIVNINQSVDQTATQSGEQEKKMVKTAIDYAEIKHLQGHKYGIEAVLFSPRNDFLISLGDIHDKGLFVWDWRNEKKISQNKLSKPAVHIEISPDQDFFVTGGYQHLKYWYLNEETGLPDARKPNEQSQPILQSHQADLTKVKQQIFVGIAILGPKIFVLASDGHIYVFDKQRKLLKWMNIKVPRAFGCSAQEGRLYCACSDGIIRIFATDTLQHLLSLQKPPPLGSTNLLQGNGRIKIQQNKTTKFADVVACAIDNVNNRAVALYSDRMMFVWDVAELKSVTVLRSMYSHSGPIHDIQAVSNQHQIGLNQKSISRPRTENEDNLTKFVTCSSDRTIRFWNFVDPTVGSAKFQEIYQCLAKNAYCKDMSQMIFITSALRESQSNETEEEKSKTPYDHFKANPQDRNEDGTPIEHQNNSIANVMDIVDSIRCIRVSPDGSQLASGDEVGNIRIHSLDSNELPQKQFIESHDSEVISLAYSQEMTSTKRSENSQPSFSTPIISGTTPNTPQGSTVKPRYLLASGGRDKQVLLYDSENNYEAFMSLDHHASTITSLHFNEYSTMEQSRQSGTPSYNRHVDIISSSADKNLISKNLDLNRFQMFANDLSTADGDDGNQLFKLGKTQICKDKILTLDIASQAQYMITGHDKSLCLWKLPTLEKVWEKRVATMEKEAQGRASANQAVTNQVQLRVMIDEYASVVVSSSTSKRVTIYEAATGTPLCRAQPGQITTAMCFSNNMKHLITTSDNGLIFIWRLPEKFAQCLQKVKNEAQKLGIAIERTPSIIEEVEDERDELGESSGPKAEMDAEQVAKGGAAAIDPKNASAKVKKEEADMDFDFDVPDSLKPSVRDNTIVKKRKEEVVDVLADIGKAANFIEKIASQQTTPTNGGAMNFNRSSSQVQAIISGDQDVAEEEEEDDEAQEISSKKKAADYPFKSKQQASTTDNENNLFSVPDAAGLEENKDGASPGMNSGKLGEQKEMIMEGNLSDGDSDNHDVTGGELEGAVENQDDQEREIWRKIEQSKYQNHFANFDEQANENRLASMRRSSEFGGRKSITSRMQMRRSNTFIPGFSVEGNSAHPMSAEEQARFGGGQNVQRTYTEYPNQQQKQSTQVTDIIDDAQDILSKKKVEEPNIEDVPGRTNRASNITKQDSAGSKNLLEINDFNADLQKHNNDDLQKHKSSSEVVMPPSPRQPLDQMNFAAQPKRERSGWGTNIKPNVKSISQTDVLGTDVQNGEQFKGFTAMSVAGRPIDTRPTFVGEPKGGVTPLSVSAQVPGVTVQALPKQYVMDNMGGTAQERKRSPVKRMMDKMFRRSPDKRKIGQSTSELIDPIKPIANPPNVNISNYKIEKNYIQPVPNRNSPTSQSMPTNVGQKLFADVRKEQNVVQSRESPQISKVKSQQQQQVQQNTGMMKDSSNLNFMPVEENKFNDQLQSEINNINASLKKINGLVSSQKELKVKNQQSFLESQSSADISMQFNDPPTQTKVNESVCSELFETMTKWNTMIKDLQESTDFDIEKVSMSRKSSDSSQSNQNNFLYRVDQSTISEAAPVSQRTSTAQSNISSSTIKEETRDILEKFSQLMLEELQNKLAASTKSSNEQSKK